jgi:hypothetical protein
VKLLGKTDNKFTFEFSIEEKLLLFEVLKLYPVIDPTLQEISKSISNKDIAQSKKLLQEELSEQQKQNKEMLKFIFGDSSCFTQKDYYYKLQLSPEQMECLLQVLNDIRVGTWKNLGSPDYEGLKNLRVKRSSLVSLAIMDVCEYFEYHLLEAME